jgi:hypothetical protein
MIINNNSIDFLAIFLSWIWRETQPSLVLDRGSVGETYDIATRRAK